MTLVQGISALLKTTLKAVSSSRTALRGVPKGALLIWIVVIFFGAFGPYVTPHDPLQIDYSVALSPPFWMEGGSVSYILGTDAFGRDMLSRIIQGARVSLIVGFTGAILAGINGMVIAVLAGYLGGWVDSILMRLTDMVYSIPFLVLGVVLAGILKPGLTTIIIILAIVAWTPYARVLRGEVLRLKEAAFIDQARVAGCSTPRIILKHIVPNIMNTFIVLGTLQLGIFILAEASLSYLGLGIQPPTPAWGSMIAGGKNYLTTAWWIPVFPGLAITVTVLAANLMGDWLRVRLDPKLRQL